MFSIIGSLEGSDGREGPAWTASSLVFHWGSTTSLYPVYIIWKIGVVVVEDLVKVLKKSTPVILTSVEWDITKDGQVLFVSPIRELVVSEDEIGTVRIVVLIDDSVPVLESL